MSPTSEAVVVIVQQRARLRVYSAPLLAVAALAVVATLPLLRWWYRHLDTDGSLTATATLAAGAYAAATIPCGTSTGSRRAVVAIVGAMVVVVLGVLADVQLVHAAGLVAAAASSVVLWRRARLVDAVPAVLLLLLALPARGDLDTFIGFPLRMLSASAAATVLSPLLGAVPRETVLVLEGRVADVEVACSGVSTVWVALAAIALLAHEHQRRRPFAHPVRTLLLAAMTTFTTVLAATTVRVAVLAAIGLWPGLNDHVRHTLGQLVHVPLGVLAFVAAVAVGALVLQRAARADSPAISNHSDDVRRGRTLVAVWLVLALLPLIASALPAAATVPRAALAVRSASLEQAAATALSAQMVPLTSSEEALFGRHADAAVKLALADGGSVLLVQARSPTAHHAPERCLASAGHSIVASSDVDGVRVTVLDDGALLAMSFFASAALPDGVTLASTPERLWLAARARLSRQPAPDVVFVSALWPRETNASSTTLTAREHARVQHLRASIAALAALALVHEGQP